MKKKFLTIISVLCVLAATASMCLAAGNNDEQDKFLYFVDGTQVTKEEYPAQTKLANEKIEEAGESNVSSFVYYIVNEEGINEVSEQEYMTLVAPQIETRTTGSWSIKNSEIKPEQTKYYFKASGDDFEVAKDEYIQLTIDVAAHARSFWVGYTGTSEGMFPVPITAGHGAKVAFIDNIKVPGTYRVKIQNISQTTEIVNGDISIYKR